jgi:dihydropteroate synthase
MKALNESPGAAGTRSAAEGRRGVLIMGVVNVTPDSFSDGGAFLDPDAAVAHGRLLLDQGADILDVGGEATNPKAAPVSTEVELARVLPVVEQLAALGARVSIDTTKAEVARAAVGAGATIVNDVSGGLFDPAMAETIGALDGVTYIAGHLRGRTLAEVFTAEAPADWREVAAELAHRIAELPAAARSRVWVDPGVGFGKGADPETNLGLLRHAGDLGRALGCPVVVGPSRKRFVRRLLPEAQQLDALAVDVASVAACLGAVQWGATVVRAHNVALLRAALAVYTKL